MVVSETTVNDIAAVAPELTAVAAVEYVPVIVTVGVLPLSIEAGLTAVTVGTGT